MSAPHGCTDDMDVVESFKEALKQRIGADRYRMWFTHGVTFAIHAATSPVLVPATESSAADDETFNLNASGPVSSSMTQGSVIVQVRGAFALDRLKKNFMRELRGAAMAACGSTLDVQLVLAEDSQGPATQTLLIPDATSPIDTDAEAASDSMTVGDSHAGRTLASGARPSRRRTNQARSVGQGRGSVQSLASVLSHEPTDAAITRSKASSPTTKSARVVRESKDNSTASISGPSDSAGAADATAPATGLHVSIPAKASMTLAEFIPGGCNQLAYTAATMACQNPGTASPLFLFGSTGVGKTHLLHAIADQLRRYHRMRTVMVLSAEQFTNDFITSVSKTGLPAFRRRYREVDALLVDDVQFLESKRATLREMLFTIETLAAAGRPLVFTANQSPSELPGLTRELSGRMAAGLVCPLQPLDSETRKRLLERLVSKLCPFAWPDEIVSEINTMLGGDARVISGVVNLVGMLQRMYQRMPTLSEIRQYGGELLRSQSPNVTLAAIERAVCETFGLQQQSLREAKQTRSVTEPRMLAMYLSRQLTPAAFNEISRHYNQKSHTSAILAAKKVEVWLESGKSIGRGPSSMSARQALDRIESILRAS